MAKEYQCPACKNAVDRAATVCSQCRSPLAFCSHCRDVSTYTLVEKGEGRFARDRLRCDRCQNLGVKCVTWLTGGYCNGLARGSGLLDKALCANCHSRASEIGRSVIGWSVIGALGGLLRPRK
jgi:predicted amidophosphoribosyltransferase